MSQIQAAADSLTIATIWHYLQRVCIEMRETMERTATNVLATSLHDLAYGIWDFRCPSNSHSGRFPLPINIQYLSY